MNITVLFNLPYSKAFEADQDTKKSAEEICQTLEKIGHTTHLLGLKSSDVDKFIIADDFVFNLVEWSGKFFSLGEKVIQRLDKLHVPYSGSHAWGYQLSSDKILMKQKMTEFKIPTPNFGVDEIPKNLKFPAISKPTYEHCGIGVSQTSVVTSEGGLKNKMQELKKKYKQPILVEEYIAGRELHVTILEKNGLPWVLPPAEVLFDKRDDFWPILTYETKWQENSWEFPLSTMALAKINTNISNKIKEVGEQCYLRLGGRSYSRIDIRLRDEEVFVLEINNNPGIGFDQGSGITHSARAVGLDFAGLLTNIIDNALIT